MKRYIKSSTQEPKLWYSSFSDDGFGDISDNSTLTDGDVDELSSSIKDFDEKFGKVVYAYMQAFGESSPRDADVSFTNMYDSVSVRISIANAMRDMTEGMMKYASEQLEACQVIEQDAGDDFEVSVALDNRTLPASGACSVTITKEPIVK